MRAGRERRKALQVTKITRETDRSQDADVITDHSAGFFKFSIPQGPLRSTEVILGRQRSEINELSNKQGRKHSSDLLGNKEWLSILQEGLIGE